MLNLLRDKVAEEDFFGGHSRIADALASIIHSDTEVRLIGLLGPWGSGKSTVLKLLDSRLRSKKSEVKNYVFVYDAWLHQSDPPRRSFIEALVEYLNAENISSADKWEEDIEKLSRRSEQHDIKNTPMLTGSGTLIAISILFLPLAYTFLDKYWYSSSLPYAGGHITFGQLAWLLFALPLLFATAIYLFWRPCRNPFNSKFWRGDNWTKNRRPHEDQNVLSVVVNRTVDKITNRIIKTPDPTAIEFRHTYNKIVTDISSKARRFVFVIDNLDRIPEKEAIRIWATVRSFFLHKSDEETTSDQRDGFRPWVILPFDPGAMDSLYSRLGEDDGDRTQAFIEKTFDVVLYIGPPVTSDWQDYLRKQMITVFGDLADKNTIYEATKIFETTIEEEGRRKNITPRQVNAFVNRTAALRLAWGDAVPFSSIAYYSLFAQQLMRDVRIVLSEDAPCGAVMRRLDPNWQANVAAMHFGVDPSKAAQLLLRPEVEQAIDEGNPRTHEGVTERAWL